MEGDGGYRTAYLKAKSRKEEGLGLLKSQLREVIHTRDKGNQDNN